MQHIAMLFFEGGGVARGGTWMKRESERYFSKNSFGLSYILLEPLLQYCEGTKGTTSCIGFMWTHATLKSCQKYEL